jgi:uncharacterized protein (TIGR00369 family)
MTNPADPFQRCGPLLDLLKITPVAYSPGHATFQMVVEKPHLRTLGLMHGGVATTLLDTALGCAAGSRAPQGHYVVTVQLNINFIRPAWEGEKLLAIGETIHTGRQTVVARGEIRTADKVLVASATGTFMFLPHSQEAGDAVES